MWKMCIRDSHDVLGRLLLRFLEAAVLGEANLECRHDLLRRGAVSYTHLDVYKRQNTDSKLIFCFHLQFEIEAENDRRREAVTRGTLARSPG